MNSTELMPRMGVEQICMAAEDALKHWSQAQEQLALSSQCFRKFSEYGSIETKSSYHTAEQHVKIAAWRFIMEQTGLRALMSLKDQEKLDSQLETGKDLPELSTEHIFGLLEELGQQIPDLMQRAVAEVFELLRPRKSGYKTNERNQFSIKSKSILSFCLDIHWTFRLTSRGQDRLRAIDNAFQLLDGKGPVKDHYSPMAQALETKLRKSRSPHQGEVDGPYYRIRYFGNGNLHLLIHRLDLLERINEIGGRLHSDLGQGEAACCT